MTNKPDQNVTSGEKLRNFDPSRSYKYIHKYLPITFTKSDGGRLRTLMLPLSYTEGKSQEEIDKQAHYMYRVFEMAEQIIDNERLRNPVLLETIADVIARTTSATITTNVIDIGLQRAEIEGANEVSIEVEVESLLQSEEDDDSCIVSTTTKNLMDRFYPIVLSGITETQQMKEEAAGVIWKNIFGLVLLDIEEQKGTNSIFHMSGAEFDQIFHEYLQRDLAEHLEESLALYSQAIAREILDYLNPAEMSLEELSKWMGATFSKPASGRQSSTEVLQRRRVHLPLKRTRMDIFILDEKEFHISLREIGTNNEVFYRGEGLRLAIQNAPPILKAAEMVQNASVKKFKFRFCEYVTPFTEKWIWRIGFLFEIEKQAPCVLEDLASMLNLRHAIAVCRSQWDSLTADDRTKVKNAEYGDLLIRLNGWLRKYGFIPREQSFLWNDKPTTGTPGLLQFWATFIALDTLQYWDEENPTAAGKSFAPIGFDVGERELVMAFPHLLNSHISGVTPNQKQEWESRRELYKIAVKNGALILPPDSFPIWTPFAQTKQDYLATIEDIARNDLATHPRQRHLINKGDRSLIDAYLKLVKPYCDRLDDHYKQNGYKKLSPVRTAEQQIAWTVHAHVLNKTYESAIDNENSSENFTAQNVRARVLEVLAKLDLSPRNDRQRGPRKQSRSHSQ